MRLGNAWNPYSRGMWTLHHLPKSTAALQMVLADQRLWKHILKKQQAEVGDHGPIGAKTRRHAKLKLRTKKKKKKLTRNNIQLYQLFKFKEEKVDHCLKCNKEKKCVKNVNNLSGAVLRGHLLTHYNVLICKYTKLRHGFNPDDWQSCLEHYFKAAVIKWLNFLHMNARFVSWHKGRWSIPHQLMVLWLQWRS